MTGLHEKKISMLLSKRHRLYFRVDKYFYCPALIPSIESSSPYKFVFLTQAVFHAFLFVWEVFNTPKMTVCKIFLPFFVG